MRIISVLFSLLSFILLTLGQQNDLLSSKVRQSLIGHLIDDIQSSEKVIFQNAVSVYQYFLALLLQTIALTERQKLALKQELEFRKKGFPPFSPRTDPDTQEKTRTINADIPRPLSSTSGNSAKKLIG